MRKFSLTLIFIFGLSGLAHADLLCSSVGSVMAVQSYFLSAACGAHESCCQPGNCECHIKDTSKDFKGEAAVSSFDERGNKCGFLNHPSVFSNFLSNSLSKILSDEEGRGSPFPKKIYKANSQYRI